jgi:hypothetical protein
MSTVQAVLGSSVVSGSGEAGMVSSDVLSGAGVDDGVWIAPSSELPGAQAEASTVTLARAQVNNKNLAARMVSSPELSTAAGVVRPDPEACFSIRDTTETTQVASRASAARERRQNVDACAEHPRIVAAHDTVDEKRSDSEHPGHRVAVTLDEHRSQLPDGRDGRQRFFEHSRRFGRCGEIASITPTASAWAEITGAFTNIAGALTARLAPEDEF